MARIATIRTAQMASSFAASAPGREPGAAAWSRFLLDAGGGSDSFTANGYLGETDGKVKAEGQSGDEAAGASQSL
jgi:hypothetical protein